MNSTLISALNQRRTILREKDRKRPFFFLELTRTIEGMASNFEEVKINADRIALFQGSEIDLGPRPRFVENDSPKGGEDNWFYKFRFGGKGKRFPSVCKSSAFEERENRSRNRETLNGLEELYRFDESGSVRIFDG